MDDESDEPVVAPGADPMDAASMVAVHSASGVAGGGDIAVPRPPPAAPTEPKKPDENEQKTDDNWPARATIKELAPTKTSCPMTNVRSLESYSCSLLPPEKIPKSVQKKIDKLLVHRQLVEARKCLLLAKAEEL